MTIKFPNRYVLDENFSIRQAFVGFLFNLDFAVVVFVLLQSYLFWSDKIALFFNVITSVQIAIIIANYPQQRNRLFHLTIHFEIIVNKQVINCWVLSKTNKSLTRQILMNLMIIEQVFEFCFSKYFTRAFSLFRLCKIKKEQTKTFPFLLTVTHNGSKIKLDVIAVHSKEFSCFLSKINTVFSFHF